MMEDSSIVQLYWERSEAAIYETDKKYGRYCLSIADNILPSWEDAQECVNDTYLAAWEAIPPHKPGVLSTFLGKLTRRISIDRWRNLTAQKRGGSTVTLALEELEACIPAQSDPAVQVEAKELAETVNRFLAKLPHQERRVFLARYFHMSSIQKIAEKYGFSDSKVKSMLHRTRKKLRTYLTEEGY